MWTLVLEGQTVASFWLSNGRKYLVGRKENECDLVLQNDSSISRVHATLNVAPVSAQALAVAGTSPQPAVELQDSSKYGTFVNGIRVESVTALKDGDIVTFGVNKHIFTLRWMEITCCATRLSAQQNSELIELSAKVGGGITNSIEAATHLICEEAPATSKTALALICGLPIVSINWLRDAAERRAPATPLPDTARYVPAPAATLQDFIHRNNIHKDCLMVNLLRKNLFAAVTFVFFDVKSYERNNKMLRAAKGTCVLDDTIDETVCVRHRGAVFVRPDGKLEPADLRRVELLVKLQIHVVSEHDILRAILSAHCPAEFTPERVASLSQETLQVPLGPTLAATIPQTIQHSIDRGQTRASAAATVASIPAASFERDNGQRGVAASFEVSIKPELSTPTDGPAGFPDASILMQERLEPLIVGNARNNDLPCYQWSQDGGKGKAFQKQRLSTVATVVGIRESIPSDHEVVHVDLLQEEPATQHELISLALREKPKRPKQHSNSQTAEIIPKKPASVKGKKKADVPEATDLPEREDPSQIRRKKQRFFAIDDEVTTHRPQQATHNSFDFDE